MQLLEGGNEEKNDTEGRKREGGREGGRGEGERGGGMDRTGKVRGKGERKEG